MWLRTLVDLAVGAYLVGLQLQQALERLLVPLLRRSIAAAGHGAGGVLGVSSGGRAQSESRAMGWRMWYLKPGGR